MEYVNGANLKDMIHLHRERLKGHKVDIIRQMAQGLNYIHSQGIIHRDICPKNILVSENKDIKIIDFGLAISTSGRYKGLGVRSGTPSYMAPEQIRALEKIVSRAMQKEPKHRYRSMYDLINDLEKLDVAEGSL